MSNTIPEWRSWFIDFLLYSGKTVVRVRKKAGKDFPVYGETIAELELDTNSAMPIYLRIRIDKNENT